MKLCAGGAYWNTYEKNGRDLLKKQTKKIATFLQIFANINHIYCWDQSKININIYKQNEQEQTKKKKTRS